MKISKLNKQEKTKLLFFTTLPTVILVLFAINFDHRSIVLELLLAGCAGLVGTAIGILLFSLVHKSK